jgi:hypothetical protein
MENLYRQRKQCAYKEQMYDSKNSGIFNSYSKLFFSENVKERDIHERIKTKQPVQAYNFLYGKKREKQ